MASTRLLRCRAFSDAATLLAVLGQKTIHQPGCLQKVGVSYNQPPVLMIFTHTLAQASTVPCYLMDVTKSECSPKTSVHNRRLQDLTRELGYSIHLHPSNSIHSLVLDHGAIVTQCGELNNNGDFVKTSSLEVSACLQKCMKCEYISCTYWLH